MQAHLVLIVRSAHPGWPAIVSALESMPDVRLIGTPTRLGEAEELATRHQPSLFIAGDAVLGERAISFMHRLRRHVPATRFLVVGDDFRYDELPLISEAGISCYLYWDDFLTNLQANLRVAIAGKTVLISDAIAAAHIASERYRVREDRPAPPITPRKLQVLRSLVEGLPHDDIARLLAVSVRAVERDVQRLEEKLGANNTHALVMQAAQRGLIP
jgi:DNA-binding NarL/FixJ family response regulator